MSDTTTKSPALGALCLTRIAAASLVVAGPWASAFAQAPAQAAVPALPVVQQVTGGMTLSQAYEAALAQDAVIRAARATADVKRERLPQALSQLLPNVSATYSKNRNDLLSSQPGLTGPVDSETFYGSSSRALTIRQPIFRPFQALDYQQAKAQVADANAQLERETQNLATRVSGAFLEALLAQDQYALALVQETAYSTQLSAARRLFAGGAGVRTDVDDAQARLDMAIAQKLVAQQNVEYTRRQLQVIVNVPVTKLATVDPAKLDIASASAGRLEDWIDRAEANSPELVSLRAQRVASQREVDKARTGHLPTLDAVAQWSVSDSDNVTRINSRYDNRSIGVQLNVPIFAGGYVNSQVRQALADLERAEQALEATRRDLNLRVEKEYRGVTEGVAQIRALEQAVRSAEITVESNRRSYQGGSRTLVDILNSEQQRVTAMRDLAQARYQYMASHVRLRALVGQADATAIAEVNGWLKP
ncbi:TolC family outer membrane protein [Caenimonas aquaedulcis]|uniref:TolC family outer membrane protein n=1 Tax=Caenimonas aquaedulcis TaxID=2793270 RepID=A0A931H6Y6_9BURK|nr:TolC family outer membrane protein [Caenimonas aquaedulcis]MBG9389804.1 TolC family outer membrane protein [Caenimonas aquaedulcis]